MTSNRRYLQTTTIPSTLPRYVSEGNIVVPYFYLMVSLILHRLYIPSYVLFWYPAQAECRTWFHSATFLLVCASFINNFYFISIIFCKFSRNVLGLRLISHVTLHTQLYDYIFLEEKSIKKNSATSETQRRCEGYVQHYIAYEDFWKKIRLFLLINLQAFLPFTRRAFVTVFLPRFVQCLVALTSVDIEFCVHPSYLTLKHCIFTGTSKKLSI